MSGWNDTDRKARLPGDWGRRVRAVMRRDQGRCHVCGEPGADAVDHILRGDDHALDNLAPIHQDVPPYCHRAKTAAEALAVRHRMRADKTRSPEQHPLDHLKGTT